MIYRLYLYKSVTKVYNIFQLCKNFLIFFIKNLIFFIFRPIFGLFLRHFCTFFAVCAPDRTRTCTSRNTRS